MSEQFDPASEITGDPVSTAGVGTLLRQAREARGLKVEEIAQTLKLGIRQVEAIEADRWDVLPGVTILRGFVRNYARLVQLDAAPLMAQLDILLAKPADTLAVPETRPASVTTHTISGARRDRSVVFAGLGLVLLATFAYVLMPNDLSALRENTQSVIDSLSRKEVPKAEEPPAAAPAPTASEPVFPPGATPQQIMNPQAVTSAEVAPLAPAPVAATPATPLTVSTLAAATPQLRFVFEKDSWIEVRDRENRVVFSQKLAAGADQPVSGSGPLSLVIGYAPGVKLFWRGQSVDLAPHTKGDVARLVLE